MKTGSFVRIATGLLGLVVILGAAASPASARITPKDGVYYQQIGQKTGYILTEKGKIYGVSANIVFRRGGEACTPEGLYTYDGITGFYFPPRRPVGPNARNRFAFRGTAQESYPKLKTSITGRFISANRAILRIKAWQGSCKGHLTLRKARYSAGG